jgi:hypothetical protein
MPAAKEPQIDLTEYAYAVTEHVAATTHAHAALTARSLARWYSGDLHGLDPALAAAKVQEQEGRASAHDYREGAALHALNAALRAGGAATGDEVTLLGHVYRVSAPGAPAVRLGAAVPTDREILAAFAEHEAHDRDAEMRSEYADAIRPSL